MADEEKQNETDYQCHGDHWDAVFADEEKRSELFARALQTSLENGSLAGTNETECTLDEKKKRTVFMLSYDGKEKANDEATPKDSWKKTEADFKELPKIKINIIVANEGEENVLASAYPVIVRGDYFRLKLDKIDEWQNGLEAVLKCETENGMEVSFFDTDYCLNKGLYKEGGIYWFKLSGLVYSAKFLSPEEAGFDITGEKANERRADFGEKPEFNEDGSPKPLHFSTEQMVAFFQNSVPDDAEFQSPAKGTKEKFNFLGAKLTGGYSIAILREDDDDGNETERTVPIVIADANLTGKAKGKKPLQGLLWLQGHYVSVEEKKAEDEKFKYYQQKVLDHLDGLLKEGEE